MEYYGYSTVEADLGHCHSSELYPPYPSGLMMHQGRGPLEADSFENDGSADLIPVLQLSISKINCLQGSKSVSSMR